MDEYLRAIGFSVLDMNSKQQFDEMVQLVTESAEERLVVGIRESDVFVEYHKKFGERFGVFLRGAMDDKEEAVYDLCAPYLKSASDIECMEALVESHAGSYYGIITDEQNGNELKFLLQNTVDGDERTPKNKYRKVNIAGLSLKGTIVLPLYKELCCVKSREEENEFFRDLAKRARSGDKDAEALIKSHELAAIQTMVKRLQTEDFLTVVEGLLLPLSENDSNYTILGNIEACAKETNAHTLETVYVLRLEVTGTRLDICINEKDLAGTPSAGMRFMGRCRLQGRIIA